MEVGDQPVDRAEAVTWGDEDLGLAGAGFDLSLFRRHRFERAQRGGADRDHATAALARGRDRAGSGMRNRETLAVHAMLRQIFALDRLERARTHVQGEVRERDAARLQACQHRLVEMQSRGRRSDRARIARIDGLVAFAVVFVGGTLDVRRQRHFAVVATLMTWADAVRRMKVRANAETAADARVARSFGAEGIGLCRTEHMFFDGERIVAVREMILSESEQGRRAALAKLLPMQRQDFAELFEIMTGLPVTIRLLDPPLHEFLPNTDEEIDEVAKVMKVSADKLRARSAELHEVNPMLGFRGVRLAIRYPEIAEMQARAIFEGAVEAGRKTGKPVTAEIMVPLIIGRPELDSVKAIIDAVAEAVAKETGVKVPYHVGTMIELPRAALRAGDIARSAEFFSFGTNDLTQTTLGVSRDDAASFLGMYTVKGLLKTDPFVSLDTEGVGELITIACERGRAARPDIKLGVCGEHGGDPASIAFCEHAHLDYVSCSPFRIPIARLAAAQAALGRKAASTA